MSRRNYLQGETWPDWSLEIARPEDWLGEETMKKHGIHPSNKTNRRDVEEAFEALRWRFNGREFYCAGCGRFWANPEAHDQGCPIVEVMK